MLLACGPTQPAGRFSAVGALDGAGGFWMAGGGVEGAQGLEPLADAWRLDLERLRWTQQPDLPEPVVRATLAPLDEGFWVFGGSDAGWEEHDRTLRIEGELSRLSTATGPGGRHKAMSLAIDGAFWIFGGKSDDGGTEIHGDVWRLDPQTETWAELPTAGGPDGMYRHAMAWDADRRLAWLHGGYDGSDSRVDWLWSLDVDTATWTQHGPTNPPPARASHTLVLHEGQLHAWGGHATDNALWSFDPDDAAWTEHPATTAPLPRDAQVADVDGQGTLWLIGGDPVSDEVPNFLADLWSLDLATATWTEHAP
jgi:hypothetical protein